MALLGQNTFSIKKIVDGKTLSFTLSANCYQQIESKDPTNFFPDFTQGASNLIVTPTLLVSGGGGVNKVVSAPNWFINGLELQGTTGTANKTTFGATVNTSGGYTLVVNKNLAAYASLNIRAEYTYTDDISGATTMVVQDIQISKTENAGKPVIAHILAKKGDTFVTATPGVAATDLTLEASLIRGGAEDTTMVTYAWFVLGTNGTTYYAITATTAPAGSGLPTGTLFAGAATKTLTVKPDAVINVGTFRVDIRDTDTTSTTYNQTASSYFTLFDATDPYEIRINLPQGDALTSTNTVEARLEVWQGGGQVADAFFNSKSLKFSRFTAAGALDTTWTPSPAFTGWTAAAGVVSRAYSAANGTAANRTITLSNSHLLTQASTVFSVQLDG